MKIGSRLAMAFLVVVAALHLLRMIFQVEITVAGKQIPEWASVLAILGPGALAFLLWRERDGGGGR